MFERTCTNCKEETMEYEINGQGRAICLDCYIEHYGVCTDCDGIFRSMFLYRSVDGKDVCRNCRVNYEKCYSCTELVDKDEAHFVNDDHHVCPSCYEANYVKCEECGYHLDKTSDQVYFDDQHRPYCNIHKPIKLIKDEWYQPKLVFGGNGPLYMGIELEIDMGTAYGCTDRMAKQILIVGNGSMDNENNIYIKQDGSIYRDGILTGLEVISQPKTLEYHKKNVPWKLILERSRQLGYKASRLCGMHVHLSRKAMGKTIEEQDETIGKMILIMEKYQNEMFILSNRPKDKFLQYASPYGLEDGHKMLNKAKEAKDKAVGRWHMLNIVPENTIEIRLFQSTLKYAKLMANLEFCKHLFEYAKTYSIEFIEGKGTWEHFAGQAFRYKYLMKWLEFKNLIRKVA